MAGRSTGSHHQAIEAKFYYLLPSSRAEPNFSVVDFRHVGSRYNDLVQDCEDLVEVTGNIGNVYMLHLLMMHSTSHITLRNLRIITNPPVSLKSRNTIMSGVTLNPGIHGSIH